VIQKIIVGRGFRGVLNYVFKESTELAHGEARIVDSNMAGRNPRELAHEFSMFRRLNPDLTRAVYHCPLTLDPDKEERLTDAQWGAFARAYLERMGFGNAPYVVVAHADNHVHIVASRVDCDGRTVSDSHEKWRSNVAIHDLEREYGLSHAVDPGRMERLRVGRDEVGMAERVGEIPPKMMLAARIDEALGRGDGSREGFAQALRDLSVTAHWNVASTGRVSGASYELAGYDGAMRAVVKGSQIGKEYRWARLEERLQERGHGRADARNERDGRTDAPREDGAAQRGRAIGDRDGGADSGPLRGGDGHGGRGDRVRASDAAGREERDERGGQAGDARRDAGVAGRDRGPGGDRRRRDEAGDHAAHDDASARRGGDGSAPEAGSARGGTGVVTEQGQDAGVERGGRPADHRAPGTAPGADRRGGPGAGGRSGGDGDDRSGVGHAGGPAGGRGAAGGQEWTTGQTERQEELDRAYAAMTSEWYKITEQVPAVGRKLADLQGTIGRRQAEMEGTARTVKKVAVTAVVTIALAAVLALALLIGLVYLAARSHKLV